MPNAATKDTCRFMAGRLILGGGSARSTLLPHHIVLLTSPSAQPRDEIACWGQQLFESRRIWRMASIAHRLERRIDLAQRPLGHAGISPPFSDSHQRRASCAKAGSPVERRILAGSFLERLAMGNDGLFELCRPALPLPKNGKQNA